MASPLSTEYPVAGEVISNLLANSLVDMPNCLTGQKEKRLLARTFLFCLPLENISIGSTPHSNDLLHHILNLITSVPNGFMNPKPPATHP